MIKTYLFDFDGTLVDSMPSFFGGIFRLMDAYGIPYGDDFVRETTPLGLDGIADYLIAGCTVVLNLELLDKPAITRMLDFLNGVAYTMDGEIKNVSQGTYIITPRGININR